MNPVAAVLFLIYITVAFCYADFIHNPKTYGDLMRQFDEARYSNLDCDCTEPIK